MKSLKSKTTPALAARSISWSPLRYSWFIIPLVIAWFGFSPATQAVLPPPDGGYPGDNTAEGTDALFSLTTGTMNTATGYNALYSNTEGVENTANGSEALVSNTTGIRNTATGYAALQLNTTGERNTATGRGAMVYNTTGNHNTADGHDALFSNDSGIANTATGSFAAFYNATGNNNTASGYYAFLRNTAGNNNTASGYYALWNNTTGNNNIALGNLAGSELTTGDNNINIGNVGVAAEANTIRIGTQGTQSAVYIAGIIGKTTPRGTPVFINSDGQLGTVQSSARFKDQIRPMDKLSEAILALKPVTFHYKKEFDPEGIPQFGLVAEDVAKVNPDLVVCDADGNAYTVRYEAVNAMLLNEFLKEHRRVEKLEAALKLVNNCLKEQEVKIEKVSARIEMSEPVQRLVSTKQK